MRKLLVLVFVLLLVSACGGSTDPSGGSETTGISTTESVTESVTTESVTESSELELAGGATFNGTFATEPGVGPGAISFVLDGEGKLIVSAIIDPALKEFACPTGVIISGGGISGTYNPGIAIESGAFDKGDWSGVFDSSTEAHGTYSLQDSFDCPYEVSWTATSG
jgi:hypothetical protein